MSTNAISVVHVGGFGEYGECVPDYYKRLMFYQVIAGGREVFYFGLGVYSLPFVPSLRRIR